MGFTATEIGETITAIGVTIEGTTGEIFGEIISHTEGIIPKLGVAIITNHAIALIGFKTLQGLAIAQDAILTSTIQSRVGDAMLSANNV